MKESNSQNTIANENQRVSIGKLLLQSGKLRPEGADRILREQRISSLRFGDAAIKLGLVKQSDIDDVLSKQFDYSYLPEHTDKVDRSLVTAYLAYSEEVERFRGLRGQLGIRWFDERKSLVVMGPSSGDGASIVAANLAISFAQLGKKTLLVDANMRKPAVHNLFMLTNKDGFSDVLASRAGFECIHSFSEINNLSILTSGTTPPNPVELIGRNELCSFLKKAEEGFDVVILDTPPAKEYCDALLLISCVKGGLIVTRRHRASLSDIEEIQKEVDIAQAEIVGAVVNEY